ncbi:MAG: family 43 glycosylhydrolase [Acidobacteriota bacterium]|nr:family 43 glycosylhydrolase [Acidobacteriota bacterium]
MQRFCRTSIVNQFTAVLAIACSMTAYGYVQSGSIAPGGRWLDTRGVQIQAHGGGILHVRDEFYWFGEDRSPGNDPDKRFVSCYSSTDLVHWRFRNQVLKLADPEHLGPKWVFERPRVFYNAKTRHFVMYAHLDDASYKLARVAIATSDKVDGNYRYLKSFRPLDQESRDIGQFVDDDGSAYLIFESRPTKGFFIAKLSDDDLSISKAMSFVKVPLEGGALVHYQGLYYVPSSSLSAVGGIASHSQFLTASRDSVNSKAAGASRYPPCRLPLSLFCHRPSKAYWTASHRYSHRAVQYFQIRTKVLQGWMTPHRRSGSDASPSYGNQGF